MESVPPTTTESLFLAVKEKDVRGVRAALEDGFDVNKKISESRIVPGGMLGFLVARVSRSSMDDEWLEIARLLLHHGVGASPSTSASFVAKCIRQWGDRGLDWALEAGVSPSHLSSRISILGKQISLFDVALKQQLWPLAQRLQDEFGVGPAPAGASIPTQSSSLVEASIAASNAPMALSDLTLWTKLMERDWPSQDLDEALRKCLFFGRLELLEQLLEKGANPNHSESPDDPISPLAWHLSSVGAPPQPGLVPLLVRYGADLSEEVDFSVGPSGSVKNVRVSSLASSDSPSVDHHRVQLLGLACVTNNRIAFLELLSAGANLDHQSQEGDTPFHLVAGSAWESSFSDSTTQGCLVDDLLDAGASVLTKNRAGKTPIESWLSIPFFSDPVPSHVSSAARRWLWASLEADPGLQNHISALLGRQTPAAPIHEILTGALVSWGLQERLRSIAPAAPSRPGPATRM